MVAKIGDRGRAACPLYPSGRVVIDRAPMAARAERGPIEEGTEIVVVGGDRFSLLVRAFDPSVPNALLPNFGEPILTAKEDAAFQAELHNQTRQQQEEDHHRAFHRLLKVGTVAGVIIGVGLAAIQSCREGYTEADDTGVASAKRNATVTLRHMSRIWRQNAVSCRGCSSHAIGTPRSVARLADP